jgi:hypothetical protein
MQTRLIAKPIFPFQAPVIKTSIEAAMLSDSVFLTRDLLTPFFEQKAIRFAVDRTGHGVSDDHFATGNLTITVLGNGSCLLRIMQIKAPFPNTAVLEAHQLTQKMVDRLRWNESRKSFEATSLHPRVIQRLKINLVVADIEPFLADGALNVGARWIKIVEPAFVPSAVVRLGDVRHLTHEFRGIGRSCWLL